MKKELEIIVGTRGGKEFSFTSREYEYEQEVVSKLFDSGTLTLSYEELGKEYTFLRDGVDYISVRELEESKGW